MTGMFRIISTVFILLVLSGCASSNPGNPRVPSLGGHMANTYGPLPPASDFQSNSAISSATMERPVEQ